MSSVSVSSSTPVLPGPFVAPFNTQVGYADIQAQLEQQMLAQWEQAYQQNSGLTSNVVGQYLANTAQAQGMSLHDLSRYENLFQPQENNLVQEANAYASAPRQQFEMGRAEAATAGAANQARLNTLNELRSYGVNPSAGEFAALTSAANTQAAAAQAAAGTEAGLQTAATGRQLRGQAIQTGQAYPSQVLGEINAAESGLSGAENSALANEQTGVNALGGPTQYGGLAMGLKYPPVGHSSVGSSASSRPSPSSGSRGSGGDGGDGGGSGSSGIESPGQADPNWAGMSAAGGGNTGGMGLSFSAQPNAGIMNTGSGSDSTSTSSEGEWNDAAPEGLVGDYGGANGENFAQGGDVGLKFGDGPTTGGYADPSMSPSRGRQTDDISARLNAGEFVMPRDVTSYYGHKHMIGMIKKAREAMGTAQQAIGPKMKPSLNQAPSFVSRGMSGVNPGLNLGGYA